MNSFVNAVKNQEARTENGMKARKSTANACVDLFFKIGAMRGQDVVPSFTSAYVEDMNKALRIAQWVRDVRGGAGERQIYRDILKNLEIRDPDAAMRLANKTAEIGRWDDLFVFETEALKNHAFKLVAEALAAGNGLAAKWTPRKGNVAAEFRKFLGWTPKFYRKTLVNLTNVVEQQMCAKDWDNINFSHVPSVAHARYKKAFGRNTQKYVEYVNRLVKGDDPEVKINAGALFPYDVIKGLKHRNMFNTMELDVIIKQWEALENFVGDANILPMVDVSGSMEISVGGNTSLSCMDVAVSLGLYLADKNIGKFKDTFLTFSEKSELLHLKGNILDKHRQMVGSAWGMSTNLHAAFDKVLVTAVNGNVPQSEMPEAILILSDMQFNQCANFDDSAMQMIQRKYSEAGYEMPRIVFWNLRATDNVPAKFDERGVALISGFSPSIMKAVLKGNLEEFSPESIMNAAIMVERYAI